MLVSILAGCSGNTVQNQKSDSQSTSFADQVNDNEKSEGESTPTTPLTALTKSAIAKELEAQFQTIADSTAMNVSISFVDFEQPENSCSYNGDDAIRSASTIKLMILYELLYQANAGLISLDENYTLASSDIVGGTGILQGYGAGYTTTFRNLAELMINQSDNVATNVIIDRLGMQSINARAAELGLESVALNRKMMDTGAIASGIENYLSSEDATTLLTMIHNGAFINPQMSEFALSALLSQTDNQGLLAGLPAGTQFAHKTGTLSNAQNDCGIVLGDHSYALAVFCEADGSYGSFSSSEAFAIMRRVAQAVSTTLAE